MAKILFIAPDEEIKASIAEAIEDYKRQATKFNRPQEDCETDIIVGLSYMNFDIQKHNADIIVSRGALAAALRRIYTDIPIVELPITTIDVIACVREMLKLEPTAEPIAVVGFGDVPYQLKVASELCDAKLVPFEYYKDNVEAPDLAKILDEIAAKGLRRVIGGVRTANLARGRGLAAVSIKSGRESIWPAITEAMHIARIRRMERERAARFETILNHVHEGVIATDVKNDIIQMNRTAANMLGADVSRCGNTPLERILPDPKIAGMMRSAQSFNDELFNLGKNRFVLNKTTIHLEKEAIGNLLTFQKVSSVQNTEIVIRSKLHHRGLTAKYAFSDIIGDSDPIQEAVRKAKTLAKAPSNILITGETGTGKELFAQSIHRESEARGGPFVAVNCAAIPENLIESEFFGYESGAFTGASKEGKQGFFELAHEGTIFLDEISEIPLNLQGKLLRVIQESEIMRLGSDRVIPVKVRIVCAVNKDLRELAAKGAFREDLYYRLAVLQLRLPSLRERGEDIIRLAEHFIGQYCAAFPKQNITLSEAARAVLLKYHWGGNIRELRNICEQLVVLNETGVIEPEDIRGLIPDTPNRNAPPKTPERSFASERSGLEREQILRAMDECGCNKSRAAELLGMNRSTLWRKLKEYDIDCRVTITDRN